MTLLRLFCIFLIVGGVATTLSSGELSALWISLIGLILFLLTFGSSGGSGNNYIFIGSDDHCEDGCYGCNDN